MTVTNPFPIFSGKLLGLGIELSYARSEKPGDKIQAISLEINWIIDARVLVWEW